ncbi:hypothetical protein Bb109J_c0137 [Bdellovibrio bacteriovorus]|uniref:hypothetical protein n=1 Tax=Bdellovibrio bacteriovorus TaxID=959 RepID=UPI00045C0BAC|nr:hypothetical protein [Bdellovibrio bacteriovorus]AHZ85797.1 hypothetical protein EP01_12750 [Bdellovibrio bacteriovorus]BEV66717.1 hypothetical protein Bb109J_c0137 [Bdellovibrio bacteriovorus]
MTKLTIKFVCVVSLIWSPVMAGAVTVSGGSTSTTTNQTTADKGVETTKGTTSQPSVKDSADKSGSANKGAQATQFLTGALMFTMAAEKWGECSQQNYGACAMAAIFTGFGILSMKQGKEHGSAGKSSNLSSFQSDGLGGNPYDYGDIDLNDPNNPLAGDPNIKALGTNTGKLTSGGMLDPKTGTIKTPDGKTYKASDFASAASMAAAGIPQGAILAGQDAYAQVSKKSADKVEKLKLGAMTASNGFSEGGGGGGGWGPASPTDDGSGSDYAGTGGSGSSGVSLERDPSSLAGMQKNYNGEPIGVAADSIFLMMTRRYKVKESQESFYTDAELALQK